MERESVPRSLGPLPSLLVKRLAATDAQREGSFSGMSVGVTIVATQQGFVYIRLVPVEHFHSCLMTVP